MNIGRVALDTPPVEAHRPIDKRYAEQRWATGGFFVVVVAAIPLYLVLGRHAWFGPDDWDFLADRSATSLHDLFRPHNVHWTTLPILVYRALFNVFGLHHYEVFELPVLLLHLTAAVLLWFIIRRLGVRPWIATLVSSVFVLFGAGYQDIIYDFQITFDGALVFGLAQLLLADHEGPVDRRDYLAVACGVLGLMCAGPALTMMFIVGLVMLLRRGWRVALLQTAPLAAIYGGWWLAIGRHSYDAPTSSLTETIQFVWRATTSTFENVSPLPGTGAFVMLVIAFGLVVAWHRGRSDRTTTSAQRLAVPLAMLAGVVAFAAIAGYGRVALFGISTADSSRYWHIILALSLPALAVAIDALTNLWRWAAVVIGAVMVIGIPTNLRTVSDVSFGNKDRIIALANAPLARNVPEGDVPDRIDAKFVTVRWLLENVDNGRIPIRRSSDVAAANATISLSLNQDKAGTPSSCRLVTRPVDRHFAVGDELQWRGDNLRLSLLTGGNSTGSVLYTPGNGYNKLTAVAPIDVRISPVRPTFLCR
jgi:hypothetical protein